MKNTLYPEEQVMPEDEIFDYNIEDYFSDEDEVGESTLNRV